VSHITDIEVLEGKWEAETPAIVLDSALAQRAIETGELTEIVQNCLSALELSGKRFVFAYETDPDA
jgi:hypothetical protein